MLLLGQCVTVAIMGGGSMLWMQAFLLSINFQWSVYDLVHFVLRQHPNLLPVEQNHCDLTRDPESIHEMHRVVH
jgi:hypothetical protein